MTLRRLTYVSAAFTALLLRRKYLQWRCALACERLRCEPWRPWGWGETTRGPRRKARAQGGGALRPVMNECATRMLRAALLMFCASPQQRSGARELLRVVLGEAPGAGRCRRLCAVVGAVDGARAANLFGEVEDDSLGWRRDVALTFDETNLDDSVLDMERVVVLSLVLFDPAFAGRMDERAL